MLLVAMPSGRCEEEGHHPQSLPRTSLISLRGLPACAHRSPPLLLPFGHFPPSLSLGTIPGNCPQWAPRRKIWHLLSGIRKKDSNTCQHDSCYYIILLRGWWRALSPWQVTWAMEVVLENPGARGSQIPVGSPSTLNAVSSEPSTSFPQSSSSFHFSHFCQCHHHYCHPSSALEPFSTPFFPLLLHLTGTREPAPPTPRDHPPG